MSEGEKLHRLLKFIVKTGQPTYEYDELIPAFRYGLFKKPNEKEIERLCSMLIFDGLVSDLTGRKKGGITIRPNAIEAFYAGKYFEEAEASGSSSPATLIALIVGGAVLGGLIWLGYMNYEKGEKLKKKEELVQHGLQLDKERVKQIDSLSSTRDSLQQVIRSLRTEIDNLKKPIVNPPTKKKGKKR